jgi:hypothetical protein
MKIATLLIFWAICCKAVGQDSTIHTSEQIEYRRGGYRLEGKKLKEMQAKEMLYKVPAAASFYQRGKKSQTVALISSLASLGCMLLDQPNETAYPYKRHNGWFIPALGFTAASVYFTFRSIKLRKMAANAYNLKIIY